MNSYLQKLGLVALLALFLLAACGPQPTPTPTPTSRLSDGDVIAVVYSYLSDKLEQSKRGATLMAGGGTLTDFLWETRTRAFAIPCPGGDPPSRFASSLSCYEALSEASRHASLVGASVENDSVAARAQRGHDWVIVGLGRRDDGKFRTFGIWCFYEDTRIVEPCNDEAENLLSWLSVSR